MASYRVVFKPSVEKDLRSMPRAVIARVFKCIEKLQETPIHHGSIKLSGAEHMYRARVGEYRIVYEVDKNTKRIVVHYIRHRRDVYRSH